MWNRNFRPYKYSRPADDEPHGTLVYLIVLVICAALVLIVSRVPI